MRVLPRLVVALLAIGLVLSLSPASAQETTWVRGVVTAIAGSTVTVKVADKDMAFTVDKATLVIGPGGTTAAREAEKAGKEGPALTAVLKVGENVEVHYSQKGAGNFASVIRRGVRGAAAPSEPAKAPSERGRSMQGIVNAVTGSSLTLMADNRDTVFAIDSATLVMGAGFGTATRQKRAAGEKTVLADFVQKGDLVLVDYRQKDGGLLATEIHMLKRFAK